MVGTKDRTKNNTRPSSSQRSVDFLGSVSGITYTLGASLSPLDKPSALLLDATITDAEASRIDPHIQVVLKKLMKRDAVTKYKALHELNELVAATEDINVVKAVLPLWPRLYKSLCTDIDHRVRENCQLAHRAFVTKLGKHIAPILKQICPDWIASQFDPYAPAASNASNSFTEAFPEHKYRDVLLFCREQIMDYIVSNLTSSSTMPAGKNYSAEEYEARYQQIVIGSLKTYGFYLKHNLESGADAMPHHHQLLSEGKYWSFTKQQIAPGIKAAWFETMTLLLQQNKELLTGDQQQKLTTAVVLALDDADVLVQSASWSCLLAVQATIPNWCQYVNIEKAFLVKMRNVTQNPSATNIHSHMLPFISHINVSVLDKHTSRFYDDFFSGLIVAVKQAKVAQTHEMKSLLDTFFECLQFVLQQLKNPPAGAQQVLLPPTAADEFTQISMPKYLKDLMTWVILGDNKVAQMAFNKNLATMVRYWEANRNKYSDIWGDFWKWLHPLFELIIDEAGDNPKRPAENQTEFILYFRKGNDMKCPAGANKSVRFGDFKEELPLSKGDVQMVSKRDDQINNWPELIELALFMCETYFNRLRDNRNPTYISAIYQIITGFNEKTLEMKIMEMTTFESLKKQLIDWLKDDSVAPESLLDLLLLFCDSQSVSTQESVVDGLLMELANENVKNVAMTKVVKRWPGKCVAFGQLTAYLNRCIEKILDHANHANALLIRAYFKETIPLGVTENQRELLNRLCVGIDEKFNKDQGRQISLIHVDLLIDLFKLAIKDAELQRLQFELLFKFSLYEISRAAGEACKQALSSGIIVLDSSLANKYSAWISQRMHEEFAEGHYEIRAYFNAYVIIMPCMDASEWDNVLVVSTDEMKYVEKVSILITTLKSKMYARDARSLATPQDESEHLKTVMKCIKTAHLHATLMAANDTRILAAAKPERVVAKLKQLLLVKTCCEILAEASCEASVIDSAIIDLTVAVTKTFDAANESAKKRVQDELTIQSNASGLWAAVAKRYLSSSAADIKSVLNADINLSLKINYLKQYSDDMPAKTLPVDIPNADDLHFSVVYAHCLLKNYFTANYNAISENRILAQIILVLDMAAIRSKELELFRQVDKRSVDGTSGLAVVTEIAILLEQMLTLCPHEITAGNWDYLRIALSSWILEAMRLLEKRDDPAVAQFIAAVVRLFHKLVQYFDTERTKSSTQLLSKVMEEWNSIFAREVNLVLAKLYYSLTTQTSHAVTDKYLFMEIGPQFASINFAYLFLSNQVDKQISVADFTKAILSRLVHPIHAVRYSMLQVALRMLPQIIQRDMTLLANEQYAKDAEWHCLHVWFNDILRDDEFSMFEFIRNFQFKLDDNNEEAVEVAPKKMIGFLFLWEIILNLCSGAAPELRSIYASWLTKQGYDHIILLSLFKLMPTALRNFETKSPTLEAYFAHINSIDMRDRNINIERLACYTYLNLLRNLPAVVRKCWTNLPHRSNLIVEKLTTYYASMIISQEELHSLLEKRDKLDKIQISVHHSTREILAIYVIDEAKMELKITLPISYPLSVAKVEGGGRGKSKNVLMQLNLFLSHQNGTIFNGLSIWKRNLDKKFEGVEECYVCYSVIHQDTYQLPKLTCKTCHKKFHSPCLYRWFSTSNKSTCPICRNLF